MKPMEPRESWTDRLLQLNMETFDLGNRSIHGPSHWAKVEHNGLKIAEKTPGCDILVVRLFAICHDVMRQDEFTDPQHGYRASDYVREMHALGHICITPEQMETLAYACAEHNNGKISENPTIGACWDADRLDLIRVGMFPDPEYFSTDVGKRLILRI